MSHYFIRSQGHTLDDADELDAALARSNDILSATDPATPATITVETPDGYLLASVSTRRIVGVFHKQRWEGRKHDYAVPCGTAHFDATHAILQMDHRTLLTLCDDDERSDDLGRNSVTWDGPCYVEITQSICDFFGVNELDAITPEALTYARTRFQPQPATEVVLPLSLTVTLQVQPEVKIQDFLRTLTCTVIPSTIGVTITKLDLTHHLPDAGPLPPPAPTLATSATPSPETR